MTKTQPSDSRKHESAGEHEGPATPDAGVFTDILCAVDGTRTSTAAVRMAAGLAGPGGHVTLLAVTAVSGSGPYATAAISPSRVNSLLSRAKRIAEDAGVPSTTVVDPGSPPVEVILERASHHHLLAIGAPAISLLGGMLIGSVAAAALGRFTTPLLIVRESTTGSLRGRRILVASDGDEGSDHIVELAGRLGLALNAHVTLLHAVGRESQVSHRSIKAQTRALKTILPDASDASIEPGNASEVIVNAATSTEAAMIVMGSRRLHGLRALGSVSRRVANDAPCSVLLLPPQ